MLFCGSLERLDFSCCTAMNISSGIGLMGASIKIPIYEAIIFYLNRTSADSRLKQHPSGIFFIGEQFVNRLPIPFGSASGGGDALFFQTSNNFPKAITSKILLKYPAHYLRLIGIHCQLTIRINIISVALALCHFGATILESFPEAVLNCFTFLYRIHYNSPSTNENTAVKSLRRNMFSMFNIKS